MKTASQWTNLVSGITSVSVYHGRTATSQRVNKPMGARRYWIKRVIMIKLFGFKVYNKEVCQMFGSHGENYLSFILLTKNFCQINFGTRYIFSSIHKYKYVWSLVNFTFVNDIFFAKYIYYSKSNCFRSVAKFSVFSSNAI